jgi:hypothetical protein
MVFLRGFLALALLAGAAAVGIGPGAVSSAQADSCWDHNGSVMRLTDSGQSRWLYYETTPHSWQAAAGVYPGTLLFNGRNSGDYYTGTARVFSRYCPNSPLEYQVEGPVTRPGGQLRITMRGTRDANNQCQNTGRRVSDTLVFTYLRNC